ncbi:MAG: hypothetical protein GWN14_05285 [candidate division Zixibacteria bacterium]|nr:hypothetical protein [candidate division Zixibacteria bacterium]
MSDAYIDNRMAKIRHIVGAETERRQRGKHKEFKGKNIIRAGKQYFVKEASRRRIKLSPLDGGRLITMKTKSFLSRAVSPIKVENKRISPPATISDRALSWARSTSIDRSTRIRRIIDLLKQAKDGSEDQKAAEWYLDQLKKGDWPIVVYVPASS